MARDGVLPRALVSEQFDDEGDIIWVISWLDERLRRELAPIASHSRDAIKYAIEVAGVDWGRETVHETPGIWDY